MAFGVVGIAGQSALAISLVGHAAMAIASLPGGPIVASEPMPTPTLPRANTTKLGQLVRRFLVPQWMTSLHYFVQYRAHVSFRAEVELSPNLRFGRGCTVSSFAKLKASGPIVMGERCGFATGCFVSAGTEGIVLGDNVICGPNVAIMSSNYIHEELDVPFEDQGQVSKGVRIGNNVWIGAGSIVADGASIGDNTIVVAGSLVNRRYPANVIIQGTPAKIIMRRGPTEGGSNASENLRDRHERRQRA